jgi:hypothetical protein
MNDPAASCGVSKDDGTQQAAGYVSLRSCLEKVIHGIMILRTLDFNQLYRELLDVSK